MISSILIEALARRAMQVYANSPNVEPTVPLFRKAFEEELERFAITSTARPVDASASASVPVKRAALLPSTQPSLGRGLGQGTGGTAESDSAEAKRILLMIDNVDIEIIEGVCGERAASFIKEMRGRMSFGGPLYVTGKQTFFFRDILNTLVYRGYV